MKSTTKPCAHIYPSSDPGLPLTASVSLAQDSSSATIAKQKKWEEWLEREMTQTGNSQGWHHSAELLGKAGRQRRGSVFWSSAALLMSGETSQHCLCCGSPLASRQPAWNWVFPGISQPAISRSLAKEPLWSEAHLPVLAGNRVFPYCTNGCSTPPRGSTDSQPGKSKW